MKEKTNFLSRVFAVLQNNFAWVILIVLALVFTIFSNGFLNYNNIINILNANAYVLVAAIGITFLMVSGAMDLSTGYMMSSCGVIASVLMVNHGVPVALAILVSLLLGIALSLLNTFLSQVLKLPILIITLGTMTIYQGLSYLISQSKVIKITSDAFRFIGQGKVFNIGGFDGFPFPIILAAVLFIVMSFVMNKTYFGRYVYALGGNEEAARLAGINIKAMRYLVAVIAGLFIAIAAIMLHSRMGSSQSSYGPGTEFTVITAILLGGVSISGGKGKLSGVLAGVLIMAIFANGMQLGGIQQNYQYLAKGSILLIAIGFDVFQTSRRKKMLIRKKTEMAAEKAAAISGDGKA